MLSTLAVDVGCVLPCEIIIISFWLPKTEGNVFFLNYSRLHHKIKLRKKVYDLVIKLEIFPDKNYWK